MVQERNYRKVVKNRHLIAFRSVVKETDLLIHAEQPLEETAQNLIMTYRGHIESYIKRFPAFQTAFHPWPLNGPAPLIIQDMAAAAEHAGVGPMAAVAGAVAEHVGKGLLAHTREVIVENGGDVFLDVAGPAVVGIYAGKSPMSMRIGIKIPPTDGSVAVCTSSGTIGHSTSFGKADAVTVVSSSCALADAAATAVGNRIQNRGDIKKAVEFGRSVQGVKGLVVIIGKEMGMWGDIEMVPVRPGKPSRAPARSAQKKG